MTVSPKRRALCAALAAAFLLACTPFASVAEGRPEPEPDPSAYIQTVHVAQPVVWQPYRDQPELAVSYASSAPDVVLISQDGELSVLKEGLAELTASTPGNGEWASSSFSIEVEALPAGDGLYLIADDPHFYLQGAAYKPGELPLETERELCRTVPALRVFLDDYLAPCRSSIPDGTEAALTALLNYAAGYYTKNFAFTIYGGAAEAGRTQWMELLRTRKGLCAPTASLFCYLMYLSSVPAMELDSVNGHPHRAHTWALIEHDGYYYNLEEYDFMVGLRDRYAIPPLSTAAAAYFPGRICGDCFVPFPIPGAALTADVRIEDMGRDLSQECPVLIYERLSDGTYRARFETVRKGSIPAYRDGTPLKMEELTYKNMESDALPDAEDPEQDQVNEYAAPLFEEASRLLFGEIEGLFQAP